MAKASSVYMTVISPNNIYIATLEGRMHTPFFFIRILPMPPCACHKIYSGLSYDGK